MAPIRQAGVADIPVLVDLWHAMLVECDLVGSGLVDDWRSRLEKAFAAEITRGSAVWWLAEIGQDVAGTCAIFEQRGRSQIFIDRKATLGGMYVRPAFRRRGIALSLAKHAIAWCRQQRFTLIRLHASRDGRPIYEALGFVTATEMMRLSLD
ncbi:MAG TPA: GNAT family N-acetyltransferase [Candidatus Baltobacteraceae bacterium]|jgi:GNAT superfamily N-acetyltransferase|nr:GNAT family N-acetyltransferase [Candidatus Baltobacteraceae bacterium]